MWTASLRSVLRRLLHEQCLVLRLHCAMMSLNTVPQFDVDSMSYPFYLLCWGHFGLQKASEEEAAFLRFECPLMPLTAE